MPTTSNDPQHFPLSPTEGLQPHPPPAPKKTTASRIGALCVICGQFLALITTGCATIDFSQRIPWRTTAASKKETPMEVVAVWTDTVLHQSGKPPQRGFGGRVYFFGKQGKQPVQVEGKLTVYAFDETNRSPSNAKPDRKYIFTPDQVAKQRSESPLGNSYNFWVPWDDVGGPTRQISLMARFEPTGGPVIISGQTKNILPGTTPEVASATQVQTTADPTPSVAGGVTPVGFDQSEVGHTPADPSMAEPTKRWLSTTTISMPGRRGSAPPAATSRPGQSFARLPVNPQPAFANSQPPPPAIGSRPVTRRAPITPAARPDLGRVRFSPNRSTPLYGPAASHQPQHPASTAGSDSIVPSGRPPADPAAVAGNQRQWSGEVE